MYTVIANEGSKQIPITQYESYTAALHDCASLNAHGFDCVVLPTGKPDAIVVSPVNQAGKENK